MDIARYLTKPLQSSKLSSPFVMPRRCILQSSPSSWCQGHFLWHTPAPGPTFTSALAAWTKDFTLLIYSVLGLITILISSSANLIKEWHQLEKSTPTNKKLDCCTIINYKNYFTRHTSREQTFHPRLKWALFPAFFAPGTRKTFSPGWCLQPGLKVPCHCAERSSRTKGRPLLPVGATNRD